MESISLRLTMKLKEPHFVQLKTNSKILTFDFLLTRFLTGWLLWRHENITTVLIRSNQKWLVWMLSRQSDRTQAKIDLWHYLNEVSKTPNWDNYLTTDFGCIMQFHANLEPVPSYNYPKKPWLRNFKGLFIHKYQPCVWYIIQLALNYHMVNSICTCIHVFEGWIKFWRHTEPLISNCN